jgi:hypothetical protein
VCEREVRAKHFRLDYYDATSKNTTLPLQNVQGAQKAQAAVFFALCWYGLTRAVPRAEDRVYIMGAKFSAISS